MRRVAVLVSAGRNPVTSIQRRAPHDAAALELALRLPCCEINAVHAAAGPVMERALREYLGMGLATLDLIEVGSREESAGALLNYLERLKPSIAIAGTFGGSASASGMLPYRLASALGWNLVAGVCGVETVDERHIRARQSSDATRLRRIEVELPAMLTVSAAGISPRPVAYGPARRGQIRRIARDAPGTFGTALSELRAALGQPVLLDIPASSAAERIARFRGETRAAGRLLVDPPAREAAEAIYGFLREAGLLDTDEPMERSR